MMSAVLLNPGHLADEISSCGVPLCVVPETETSFNTIVQRTVEFVLQQNAVIIHSHRYKENLIAARVSRRAGISHLVRTQHGLPEPLRGIRSIKRGMINLLDRAVARPVTDRVISVSEEISRHLCRVFEPHKVIIIPNGIDAESVKSNLTREEAKLRLGLSPNCHVIGTAGRLEPVKRFDLFLRTAAVIDSDAQFVIAGAGREAASLTSFAAKLNLSERTHFVGHRDDIHDVLRAFDVMLLTSDHEGMPMIVLEAMALGVPVVSRAVGGIPEVIEHEVNGLLVQSSDPRHLADACMSILGVSGLAEQLIKGGMETVRGKFSAARNAARVAELYLSLCGRK